MTKIRILDPDVVNQIAAGEVVERPASVVKELVENAVDAGAETVRIEITTDQTSITRIRVVDDGAGMTKDEAHLAFHPHATSKIRDIADLNAIRTLGFRGEALASIAAVSQVTMVTRPRGGEVLAGTRVEVRGGEVVSVRETGSPEGTSVTVEDLFYNTPARKKFLKSRNTEIGHIYAVMEKIALSHTGISFSVAHNTHERIATQRSPELLEAIVGIFGSDVAQNLIPVNHRVPFMRISGYISRPSANRAGPDQIYIALNQRSISSRPITGAIREGYGTLLPKDRYPVAFLMLDIDLDLVDVNVHPTKREVRLSREPEILLAISDAVADALDAVTLVAEGKAGAPVQQQLVPETGPDELVPQETPAVHSPDAAYASPHRTAIVSDRQLRRTDPAGRPAADQNLLPAMDPIGQIGATYIVARTAGGDLLLIDQHAAHERILYEQVEEKRGSSAEAQELVTPVIVEVRPREAQQLREALPLLEQQGFVVEEFGRDTYTVRAVPAAFARPGDTEAVRDLIADLLSDEFRTAPDRNERITQVIACRGAVKAGAVLAREQQLRLIDQLSRTNTPWTCPHGRPTVIAFSKAKLDGMFGR